MFKSDAKLFLAASNDVNLAKTLINECKKLILDFDLAGNSDSASLKSNINSCDINTLVTKVEDTKESLMKLDQGFASEYMTLLQEYLQTSEIDTSNMTEEEKIQYDIKMDAYSRDYNQTLLYMLEKNEESGMLTTEMRQQLQYQRKVMGQYYLQDKMAVLDPTTDEYIKLFKMYSDNNKQLINMNPGLTEEEKTKYLKEHETQYKQNLDMLINARDARIKRENDEKELAELYGLKEYNSGFWHPFVENEIDEAILDKKIAMGIASEDEITYKNMNGWDRFWTDTGTFAASTFTGLYNITEGIGDGFVMLGSAVGLCDKNWASEHISRDLSGELYQGIQLSNGMNTYSAYGTWHTAGEVFGGFVGKVGMSFAAPWASAVLSGLEAAGQSAETSFNNGDKYWSAFGKSLVSGIGGAAEGYAFSNMNLGIRNFVSSGSLKILGKNALSGIKNFGTTLTSPGGLKVIGGNLWNLTKSGVKNIPSALGKAGIATLKDPDALIETGCVIANNVIEGVTTGDWDLKKMFSEAGLVFATNYFMNFATTLAFDFDTKKPNIDDIPEVSDSKFATDQLHINELDNYQDSPVYNVENMSYELSDNKSKLDRISEVLNEWGIKHGKSNYAEVALKQYVETGTAYYYANGTLIPYITNTNGVRNYIETLDPKVVAEYLYNKNLISNGLDGLNNRLLTSGNLDDLSAFFDKYSSKAADNYGVDQGGIANLFNYYIGKESFDYRKATKIIERAKKNRLPIPDVKKVASKEYFELKNKLILKGFTDDQASLVLYSINNGVGACSYAGKANSIFYKFSNNPKLFEEKFGFPMYRINSYGETVLNSNELLLDLFVYANDTSNGGKLFTKNLFNNGYDFHLNNNIDALGKKVLDVKQQAGLSTNHGSNNQLLKNYFNQKDLEWDSFVAIENMPNNKLSNNDFSNYFNTVYQSINEGKAVQVNIFQQGSEVRFINSNPKKTITSKSWNEGGGHAVFVTGMTKEGFVVSSWGKKYFIPFQDLNNGAWFTIMIDDIS